MEVVEIAGHRCIVLGAGDEPIRDVSDATNIVGDALGEQATVIAVPVASLDASFFELRSGFAGEVLQKAANYGMKFAVIGDVSEHTAASNAFRDLVVESQRSTSFFFLPDLEALRNRFAAASSPRLAQRPASE